MYTSIRGIAPLDLRGRQSGRGLAVARVVWLLGCVSLLTDLSSEMVAAILPMYLTVALGMSPWQYGVVDGLYQGVAASVRLVGGISADLTRRPKWVALVGYLISALAKLALLPATALASIGVAISADRIGKGLRTAPRDAMIADASAPSRLGLAFGVHRTLDTIGATGGPLLSAAILLAIPGAYSSIFLLSFCLAIVGVAVLGLLVPDVRPAGAAALSGIRPALRAAGRMLRAREFRLVTIVAGVLSLVTVSDGFVYLCLRDVAGFPAAVFPLLFVGTSLVYLLFAVPCGRLADAIGRGPVFAAGNGLAAMAYLVVLSGWPAPILVITVLALLGLYYACTDGVLSALAAPLVPDATRSTGLAVVQSVTAGGHFLASLAFGAAWTLVGRSTALGMFAIALLAGAAVAGVLLRKVGR